MNKPYNFNTSPAARLAYYKAYAAQRTGYDIWKSALWQKPAILLTGKHAATWSDDRKKIFVDSLENCPFKYCGAAYGLANISHTGWYVDSWQDDVMVGAVVAIRVPSASKQKPFVSKKQKLVFYPATYCTGWDGATIYMDEPYESARDAAYRADQIAQREAEAECEYRAKDEAEQALADARDSLHANNKAFLLLRKECKEFHMKHGGLLEATPALLEVISARIRHHLRERSNLFEQIAKLSEQLS